jgi:hypothetical protein
MTQVFHDDLFTAFAALTNLDAEHLRRGGSFTVDDIECAMLAGRDGGNNTLSCQIDFGLPPSERMAAVLASLLELNYLQAPHGACFALAPVTGHVVYVLNLPMDAMSAESLADTFEACAAQARAWREHQLLDQKTAEGPLSRMQAMQLA